MPSSPVSLNRARSKSGTLLFPLTRIGVDRARLQSRPVRKRDQQRPTGSEVRNALRIWRVAQVQHYRDFRNH